MKKKDVKELLNNIADKIELACGADEYNPAQMVKRAIRNSVKELDNGRRK